MVWVAMGVVMVFWTTFEFLSAWLFEETVHACIRRCKDPCPEKTAANSCIEACANPCPRKRPVLPYFARLVFVPWFLIAAFTWWALSYLLYHFFLSSSWRDDRRPFSSLDPGYKVYSYLFALNPRSYSPTRGEARISIQALRLLTIAVNFMIIFTAIGAFIDELYTASATQIAALIVSFHAGPRHYFDAEKPHKSRLDDIRIPLSGHIDQCLIYILHLRCSNFDVKHLVRLESEHNAVDTYRLKMEELEVDTSKFNLKECRNAMNNLIISRIRNVIVRDDENLVFLARHLNETCGSKEHGDGTHFHNLENHHPENGFRTIRYNGHLVRNTSLVGRDVVMALLHWERLLFEWRNNLSSDLQARTSTLRSTTSHPCYDVTLHLQPHQA